jgi:hypothetical protein
VTRHRRKLRALRGRYGRAARIRLRTYRGYAFELTYGKRTKHWGFKVYGGGTSAHIFLTSIEAADAAKRLIDKLT